MYVWYTMMRRKDILSNTILCNVYVRARLDI